MSALFEYILFPRTESKARTEICEAGYVALLALYRLNRSR